MCEGFFHIVNPPLFAALDGLGAMAFELQSTGMAV